MPKVRNIPRQKGNNWGDEKRIQTVSTYLATGSGITTAAIVGVPVATIRQWRLQPWWDEVETELQREDDAGMDVKLRKIVDKSLDLLMDRLDNGDLVYVDGDLIRKPVNALTVTKVSDVIMNKRDLLKKKKHTEVVQETLSDHLALLATKFAEFVDSQKPNIRIIEGDVEDATPSELQEGVRAISGPTGPNQETGRTE